MQETFIKIYRINFVTMSQSIQLPRIYTNYESKGFFDVKTCRSRDDFENKYIWFYDMEWMNKESILNYNYEEGEDRRVIPFARTGGGDLWGWYKDEKSSDNLPVVFCPKEDDEGIFYAPSFLGAIFRHILEFSSQNNFCCDCNGKEWEMSLDLAHQHINRWLFAFSKDMSISCEKEIQNLLSKELRFYNDPESSDSYYVLLAPNEALSIIKECLNYNFLNKSFVWFNK